MQPSSCAAVAANRAQAFFAFFYFLFKSSAPAAESQGERTEILQGR